MVTTESKRVRQLAAEKAEAAKAVLADDSVAHESALATAKVMEAERDELLLRAATLEQAERR